MTISKDADLYCESPRAAGQTCEEEESDRSEELPSICNTVNKRVFGL